MLLLDLLNDKPDLILKLIPDNQLLMMTSVSKKIPKIDINLRIKQNFKLPKIRQLNDLSKRCNILVLYLIKCNLCDKEAKVIADLLYINNTLYSLYLNQNNIGDLGAQLIGRALTFNKSLTKINLMCNEIKDIGTFYIAKSLQVNTKLRELDLSYNKIDNEGAKHIAIALCVNTTLTELNLMCNLIKDKGIKVIALALSYNITPLEKFHFGYNIIYMNNKEVINTIFNNTTLTELNLSGTCIGDNEGQ